MNALFGKCSLDRTVIDPGDLARVSSILSSYGPDREARLSTENFIGLIASLDTTKESRREQQPLLLSSGLVINWDGRLDNAKELTRELGSGPREYVTDLDIVAAAYERWGRNGLAKLIGDWAIAVWNPQDLSLTLAKDVVGTRHLYYSVKENQITWCSVLDPLVLFAGRTLEVEEEYVAGWLAAFPASTLTPYVGIHSVSPGSFVHFKAGQQVTHTYWSFDPERRIHYRNDSDYEEQFRSLFAQAVRRRLRSQTPVLAELSGGIDSSSIVCMADDSFQQGDMDAPRLDTISCYDPSEPNWDERPFFTAVEQKRGRVGLHIKVDNQTLLDFEGDDGRLVLTPNSLSNRTQRRLQDEIRSQGYRVLLSGIGGDEVTGGVPTPTPELADLLMTGEFRQLSRQLRAWAIAKRRPWFYLLGETLGAFWPTSIDGLPAHRRPAEWLRPAFLARNYAALRGYEARLRALGPLPSFQENINALNALRRQLACSSVSPKAVYEKRYPFLDRDLLEFLYAIPREQLLRPGCRRSLLRRSLRDIVPAAILERRRKAFVSRGPTLALNAYLGDSRKKCLIAEEMGIVDAKNFSEVIEQARRGSEVPLVTIVRTLLLEYWLRNVLLHRIVAPVLPCGGTHQLEFAPNRARQIQLGSAR
jgi:asparagine synthase (glutamine-hydrolysing)